MKFRFPEPTVMGSWCFFFYAKGVLWQCEHARSPAGFCDACGDTYSSRARNRLEEEILFARVGAAAGDGLGALVAQRLQ